MSKGLGIAALILALIAFGVPVVGLYVSWLALALAVFAALSGDKMFAVATPIIAAANTFFFSPLVLIAFFGENQQSGSNALLFTTVILLVAPIVAILLFSSGKFVIGKPVS